MSLADLNSPKAVMSAIAEFDLLGRDQFLSRYGYGSAREYLIRHKGKEYDLDILIILTQTSCVFGSAGFPSPQPVFRPSNNSIS
jgi:hypothetical protein